MASLVIQGWPLSTASVLYCVDGVVAVSKAGVNFTTLSLPRTEYDPINMRREIEINMHVGTG